MDNKLPARLHAHLATIAPITGLSIGIPEDRSTWRVHFTTAATEEQKTAAQQAMLDYQDAPVRPITAEEVFAILERKGVLNRQDRDGNGRS